MRVEVNYDLEYQVEEARGLASEALNIGFRPRIRLAEVTWYRSSAVTHVPHFSTTTLGLEIWILKGLPKGSHPTESLSLKTASKSLNCKTQILD